MLLTVVELRWSSSGVGRGYLLIVSKSRVSRTFSRLGREARLAGNVRVISNGFLLVSLVTIRVSFEVVCLPSFGLLVELAAWTMGTIFH